MVESFLITFESLFDGTVVFIEGQLVKRRHYGEFAYSTVSDIILREVSARANRAHF